MISTPIYLRVKGPFACFTRPEFHVERVSYPVITPSAARGVLEAILMKPIEKPESAKRHNKVGFAWHILRLGILTKGTLMPILRNELGYESHPSYGNTKGFDIMEKRTQRHSLILKDVEYLIEAVIDVPEGKTRCNVPNVLAKYHQMFLRRAEAGQCFYQPFLGCREFSVSEWELVKEPAKAVPDVTINDDFGFIFRDFDFAPVWQHWGDGKNQPRPNDWSDPRDQRKVPAAEKYQVHPVAQRSLHAKAVNGWITVHSREDGRRAA